MLEHLRWIYYNDHKVERPSLEKPYQGGSDCMQVWSLLQPPPTMAQGSSPVSLCSPATRIAFLL